MAIHSSLVTAAKDLNSLSISVSSKVSANDINVDAKAKTYYNELCRQYDKVASDFTSLGNQFTDISKYIISKKNKKSVQKMAKTCVNQAKHCKNRKNELTESFSFGLAEHSANQAELALARVAELEAKYGVK